VHLVNGKIIGHSSVVVHLQKNLIAFFHLDW
jgi:hypothetical protein